MGQLSGHTALPDTSASSQGDQLASPHAVQLIVEASPRVWNTWLITRRSNDVPSLLAGDYSIRAETLGSINGVNKILDSTVNHTVVRVFLRERRDDLGFAGGQLKSRLLGCCSSLFVLVEAENNSLKLLKPIKVLCDHLFSRLGSIRDRNNRPLQVEGLTNAEGIYLSLNNSHHLAAVSP